MEKSLFEQVSISYHQEGDYLLPNLAVPESIPVGIWGQRRRRYLREHSNPIYTALFLSGKLDAHLAEIDHQAEEIFSQLVMQMMEQEGVTEQLKTDSQMEWVGRMNNIRDRAMEMINAELIFI
ncbi:MAG: TnpV protein [Oscillospiraceae bacterium]|nr:TnpV protein [Oscillospiraceae bacterium]